MNRLFYIECEEFSQTDFELIHRHIRKRLDPKNKEVLIIKSIPLNTEMKRFIKGLGVKQSYV